MKHNFKITEVHGLLERNSQTEYYLTIQALDRMDHTLLVKIFPSFNFQDNTISWSPHASLVCGLQWPRHQEL